ncbi:STAS domain-containing protein [Embleya sp. NBC_00896]|uniref:STAS domain-containing protein n=1 Tax=Embleya sp. NBC_00896 TaxID=2975961 RepID=UPI00386B90A3|nr:STAS domain-containing protein [Embleya sp. NBC_00896]
MRVWGDPRELHLEGALDVRATADVRLALHDALDSGDGDLILNLSRVPSLDTTGLGLIVGAHRRAGRRERRLVLTGVNPEVYRVLVLTRLHRILTLRQLAAV